MLLQRLSELAGRGRAEGGGDGGAGGGRRDTSGSRSAGGAGQLRRAAPGQPAWRARLLRARPSLPHARERARLPPPPEKGL